MHSSAITNGTLTRIDAISAHEIIFLDNAPYRTPAMLDVIFIGIAVVFLVACLGYTLVCERL